MIRVFWKAAIPGKKGAVHPITMPWASYLSACLEARHAGPHAVLVRLPGDPEGHIPQPARLPV